MTRVAGDPRAPMEQWNAEVLRLTVFFAPGPPADASNWWRNLTNTDPESSETKPRMGVRTDSGGFNDGLLIMQFQTNRADWIYGNRPDALGEPIRRNLGERLPVFSEVMAQWLAECPQVIRMAFGAIVLFESESREDSYRFLSNYLPFDLDPENCSEFNFQINRVRRSRTLPGLRINRLARWSAVRQVFGNLSVGEGPNVVSLSPAAKTHGGRLELDMNTSEERNEVIPEASLRPLFSELVQLGMEIVREGDIP